MGKVTINYRNIAILKRGFQKAIGLTAEAIKTDLIDKQIIPFDKSTLQTNTDVDPHREPDKAYVVSNMSYARRLYFHPEYHFRKDKNHNAGAKWFEPWTSRGKRAKWVLKRFEQFIKECADV